MKEPIRISIVEDDEQIRNMFIVLLEGAEGFRCVSAYPSAEAALADLSGKQPDIVLMDSQYEWDHLCRETGSRSR
ncbi:MAG: response regulator [Balneolaceae bacterium]|nr:response regulator [Balneolaceae bacterium]